MSVQAWLIFLFGAAMFFGYCLYVVLVGPGTAAARRDVVLNAIKKVFGANKPMVIGAVAGMLTLNSFFAVFPADRAASAAAVSASEEGRLLAALALFLLLNAAWYTVLVRTTKAIHAELKKL